MAGGDDLRLGSLFAGIGGFDLAAEQVGMTSCFQVEIDTPATRVLDTRFPDAFRHDDVTTADPDRLPDVEIMTAGSPCQDFSVAGARAGLEGARSNLFWHFVRLIDAYEPRGLRYAIWENVPGALSSNDGKDFENVVAALVGADEPIRLGGRSGRHAGLATRGRRAVSWRVLDAQYFGVAQRRRRVFACVAFGDSAADRAVQILFEPEGVPRDLEAGAASGEDVAGTLGGGSGRRGWAPDTDRMTFVPVAKTLMAGAGQRFDPTTQELLPVRTFQKVVRSGARDADGNLPPEVWAERDVASTLNCFDQGDKRAVDVVVQPVCVTGERTHALTSEGSDASEDGTGRGTPITPAVAAPLTAGGSASPGVNPSGRRQEDDHNLAAYVSADYAVRRLTPVECERLQGFPDGWTDIEGTSDSARYRQLGNAVPVPVARFILDRIVRVEAGTL